MSGRELEYVQQAFDSNWIARKYTGFVRHPEE
jgi:hypothetical protein